MSFVRRCFRDSGTIETPSPAATRFKVEVSCGVSWLTPGAEARAFAGGDHGIGQSRAHVSMIEHEDLFGETCECRRLARRQSMPLRYRDYHFLVQQRGIGH